MQGRGIIPSAVENTIKNGERDAYVKNTNIYFDDVNRVSIVINEKGDVITVSYGNLGQKAK